ncbi:ACT domain-containing protein [Pontibacter ramchanderi]|uniref:ACT domain-containing protein n=1 Tax=Pontibacter ramchanderi TaxID=1179743 RepID=A0A2N3U821_9BACT|nr:hypothetical protein [Pontibacter ramchanderi]PKV62900.1 hypothetical protein BD749_2730 [Pontibacter ramchanderi]
MQESFVFTISAAGDKSILNRVLMLYTRRNIAFERLTASRPDDSSHYSFRIEANTTPHWAEQITKELQKIIGVRYATVQRQEEGKQPSLEPHAAAISRSIAKSKPAVTASL